MKELTGDMFSPKIISFADALCVTTNGFSKKDGRAVMGRGNAKQAKDLFDGIDLEFGQLLKKNGNVVQILRINPIPIVSFPVKHNWWEKADLELIRKSTFELVKLTDWNNWKKIILPRPGCYNGKLKWFSEVKPILKDYLDDRFYLISLR